MIAAMCGLSIALTAVICRYADSLAEMTGLLDRPDGIRKLHSGNVPLVGGLAFLIPSFSVSIFYAIRFIEAPFVLVATGAGTAMMIVGVADDRFKLPQSWRFIALSLVGFTALSAYPMFLLHALRLSIFGYYLDFELGPFSMMFTLLMLVGFVNAVNLIDGVNGLLLGSVAIWCAFITYYLGVDAGLPFLAVACSAIVTFYYNLRGRLFSGSSGAYGASLFVGLGTIAAYRMADGAMSADVPLTWFWLPVADCLRVMFSRLIDGKSPFVGDRNHFHHLLAECLPQRYLVASYLVLLAAPGSAIMLNESFGVTVLLICVVCYVTFFLFHRKS